ncbi:hypothetical protein AGMMS49525_14170 [Bacteroidia bacterium]|nr:hypothetical protein AGMMS49525_14170 [Bacteroidia bacterium]
MPSLGLRVGARAGGGACACHPAGRCPTLLIIGLSVLGIVPKGRDVLAYLRMQLGGEVLIFYRAMHAYLAEM